MGEAADRRTRAIQLIQARLAAPRLLMTFILLLVFGVGFLFSRQLHDSHNVDRMGFRYPLAIGFAYLFFLVLLGIWLVGRRWRGRRAARARAVASNRYRNDPGWWWWNVDVGPVGSSGGGSSASGSGGGSSSKGLRLDGDGDGLAFLVVVVLIGVAVAVALGACLYVIVAAPALLAEALVDGVFLTTMARRVGSPTHPHWLAGVVRRTWLPAVIMAVVFSVVGFGLEAWAPGATTMAEALRKVLN
jgi:hypothetical protein